MEQIVSRERLGVSFCPERLSRTFPPASRLFSRCPGFQSRLYWTTQIFDPNTLRSPTCVAGRLMRFTLIDRIIELEPGVHITAIKTLTMAEEYLADHFPRFPVMPGVLMLEAMTQAGAWLVRASEDFSHSMVMLKQAVNIKYGQFLEPGQTMVVRAEILKRGDGETKLKAHGTVKGQTIVSARLTLAQYNLGDSRPDYVATDQSLRDELRDLFKLLYRPSNMVHESSTP
jgi:3-hydroxyacyl-[acyl-carrier-protein] dehydratase